MFLAIEGTYQSSLSTSEIQAWLDYLEYKESGVWIFKGRNYEVKRSGNAFSLRKCGGGGRNGPIYPWIEGSVIESLPTKIKLTIKPAYYSIGFLFVFGCVMFSSIWLSNEMKINGVHRVPNLVERLFFSLFVIAILSFLSYCKIIRPMQEAEE